MSKPKVDGTLVNLPFAFGEAVFIDGGDIKGTVIGYTIYPHEVTVQVAWFANGDHKHDWFGDWRLKAAGDR